jgi:hypothetical protein
VNTYERVGYSIEVYELGDYKLVEKFKPLLQEEEDQQYQLQKGDNIKIRITDPFVSIHSLSYAFLAQ